MELARRPTVSRDRRDPPAAIEDSGRPRAQLYFWVLVGITLGILLGYFFPAVAVQLEPLGDSFVNLIKMVIAPVIFCTVVVGLDGTSIYLTLAAIYVAQAQNVRLSIGQQLAILAVLLLTSKGAAGVTGSGFIVLAATLSAVGRIPVAGIMRRRTRPSGASQPPPPASAPTPPSRRSPPDLDRSSPRLDVAGR